MQALGALAAALAFIALMAAIGALITQWAWGVVMVPVFGLPSLSLVQAFALNLLASFLVKGGRVHVEKARA